MKGCPWWGPASKEVGTCYGSLEVEFENTLSVLKIVSVFIGF